MRIDYSPMALEDLKDINDYLLENWGESMAKKSLRKIISDINTLSEYGRLGSDLGQIIDVPTKYRYILSEKNYVFYYLEVDKIKIVRVLHERQNYMEKLFGDSSQS